LQPETCSPIWRVGKPVYHCHHSKGPGGEIPVADGISLGSLWNRSGHSGHPGANIPRSLSVERTDRAEYSIFKVQKVLFTIHAKYEIFCVGFTQNFGFFYESTTLLPKAFPFAKFLERKIQDSFFSRTEHGSVEIPLQRR